jgi:hypothetical protein
MHGNRTGRSAAGDEHTGKDAQQNHAEQGCLGFVVGSGDVSGYDLSGGNRGLYWFIDISFFFIKFPNMG